MQIFHASDLHYSPANLTEADRCFGFAIDDAIERGVSVAVISGDSTDHRLDAHSPVLLALARRIKQLADHCPVFMLQGTFSHEPAGMLQIFAMIGARHPVIVSDRIEMIGLQNGHWTAIDASNVGDDYDLAITSIPTLNKADLAIQVGAENAAEAMGDHLATAMHNFAPANALLRQRGVPTILVTHGTVDGSLNENGVPMAGLDHEFRAGTLYLAGTNAILMGHIHAHQTWERDFDGLRQVIAYPGSIGRFHYGEQGEKYYLLWSVESNSVDFQAIATPSKRMIDLRFDGAPDVEEIRRVAAQCEGAFVRVTYNVDEEFASTVDRNAIKDALGGAAEVKIEGMVMTIQRQRCAGITGLASVDEKFKLWCEITGTPSDGLSERIAKLMNADPSDIANEFAVQNRRAVDIAIDAQSDISSISANMKQNKHDDLLALLD